MKTIKGFLLNLQFFTIVPIRMALPIDKQHVTRAIQTFPIVGILQGIIASSLLYGLLHGTPLSPLAITFIVFFVMVILTGGLHIDGWIDTADAFFAYQEKEKRLEIMSDPRVGAFGVLAVLFLLAGKFLFLYEVILHVEVTTYFLIAFLPFLSKSAMGYMIITTPTAKQEGMAYFFKSAVNKKSVFIYIVYAIIYVCLFALVGVSLVIYSFWLIAVAFFAIIYFKRKAKIAFGGITGDVLGATVEGMEFILWMTVWLLHYYAMG